MDTIKIGVAGLGRLGLIHAHNIAGLKGVELTAVSNLDKTVNQQTKEKYSIPYTYTAYEDMIQNEELDAVCIVTPSGFHPDHIYKGLKKTFMFSVKNLLGWISMK
ncbi:Gfo/Idh/MocA family protein [Salibacterium lacus]|uniref:Gfo/Idh/MocA family protein n=1 Tax=Salibacterium lacus TaxID=1898109 RepID=A0ABW5T2I8_9BACI